MIRSMLSVFILLAATLAAAPTPPNATASGQSGSAAMPPPPPMSEPSSGSAPAASPNPAMLAQAKSMFTQLQNGTIDRSLLAPSMSTALSDDKLSSLKSTLGDLGAPVTFEQQKGGTQGDITYAVYLLTFKDGTKLQLLDVIDKTGKVAGLKLTPQ